MDREDLRYFRLRLELFGSVLKLKIIKLKTVWLLVCNSPSPDMRSLPPLRRPPPLVSPRVSSYLSLLRIPGPGGRRRRRRKRMPAAKGPPKKTRVRSPRASSSKKKRVRWRKRRYKICPITIFLILRSFRFFCIFAPFPVLPLRKNGGEGRKEVLLRRKRWKREEREGGGGGVMIDFVLG